MIQHKLENLADEIINTSVLVVGGGLIKQLLFRNLRKNVALTVPRPDSSVIGER